MARKDKLPLLINVGRNQYDLAEPLAENFEYLEYESVEAFDEAQSKPLFDQKKGRLHEKYRNSYFLLDMTSPLLDDPGTVIDLPANLLIVADDVLENVSPDVQRVLKLKGAFEFDLNNLDHLVHELKYYFFVGNEGLGLQFDHFVVNPNFAGKVRFFGRAYQELSGFFGDDWTYIGYNRELTWTPGGVSNEFFVEYEELEGAELKLQLRLVNPQTGEVLETMEASGSELRTKVFQFEGGDTGYLAQFNYFARGTGTLHLGEVHLHHSRGKYGVLSLNGQRLISDTGMNGSIEVYFDAGDLKPPLNIFFSGWRQKESFEGNFIMQSMGSPFILISDNRLEGGTFYIGDESLEQKVVDYIRQKLDDLGFDETDVILGGLSMGTYAALYYGSHFKPYAILVGKPLVNLGTIAENGRIFRPQEFMTSNDMVLMKAGSISEEATKEVDQYFWDRFKQGDFSHTTFAFAYMLQDDYDRYAFPQLQSYLGKAYPTARVLSKGLIGRHNDDTIGIVNWFMMQYNYLIRDGFGRGGD